jgi:hypothetical protein
MSTPADTEYLVVNSNDRIKPSNKETANRVNIIGKYFIHVLSQPINREKIKAVIEDGEDVPKMVDERIAYTMNDQIDASNMTEFENIVKTYVDSLIELIISNRSENAKKIRSLYRYITKTMKDPDFKNQVMNSYTNIDWDKVNSSSPSSSPSRSQGVLIQYGVPRSQYGSAGGSSSSGSSPPMMSIHNTEIGGPIMYSRAPIGSPTKPLPPGSVNFEGVKLPPMFQKTYNGLQSQYGSTSDTKSFDKSNRMVDSLDSHRVSVGITKLTSFKNKNESNQNITHVVCEVIPKPNDHNPYTMDLIQRICERGYIEINVIYKHPSNICTFEVIYS